MGEKDDLVCRLLKEANDKQMMGRILGEKLATVTEELPACVCGSSLVHVSGEERAKRFLDTQPGASRDSLHYQMLLHMLTSKQGASLCMCDLCGANVGVANAVWTCRNGDCTILHATSYDICDECFMRYAAH